MKEIVSAVPSYCAIHFEKIPKSCYRKAWENSKDCRKSAYFWLHVATSPQGPYCLSCIVEVLNKESEETRSQRLAQLREFLKDYPELALE